MTAPKKKTKGCFVNSLWAESVTEFKNYRHLSAYKGVYEWAEIFKTV